MMDRGATAAVLGAVLALTACAGSDDAGPRPRGGGGEDQGLRSVPNLFISPSGEPFRAVRTQPYPVAQWFSAADLDHDGHLTREEFRTDAARFFKTLDTNQDGVIDGFELQHYERVVAPEINPQIEGLRFGEGMDLALGRNGQSDAMIGKSPQGSRREQAGDQKLEGAGVFGLLNEPEPVAATDASFDSHITLKEFLDAADRRFTALDKKNLGYLTLETLPKTPAQVVILRVQARLAKQNPPKQP